MFFVFMMGSLCYLFQSYGLKVATLQNNASQESYLLHENKRNFKYITNDEIKAKVNNGKPTFVMFWATWCSASKLTLKTYLMENNYLSMLDSHNNDVLIVCMGGVEKEIENFYSETEIDASLSYVLDCGNSIVGNALYDRYNLRKSLEIILPGNKLESKLPQYLYTDSSGVLMNNKPNMKIDDIIKLAGVKIEKTKSQDGVIIEKYRNGVKVD
jgi:thiol-disulfide isomerase/thioredoxin